MVQDGPPRWSKKSLSQLVNTEALQALAEAKAIDQNAENGKDQVIALIDKLSYWEANEVEVNAVYDGTLADAPIQATSENVVLPGWVTKSGNTRQTFSGADNDNGGKACLEDADDQVGLFVHPGVYNYGETVGYTMPLKGGVLYCAEAKYCAWANGSNNNFTLTILKDGATIASKSYGKNSVACTEAGALKNVKLYFTPEVDGDYVLSVNANGNTFMTDFYIMRAKTTDLELLENETAAPEEQYAATVTYNRTLKQGLNTIVLPFETTAEEIGASTVLMYGGTHETGGKTFIHFDEVAADANGVITLKANTPYALILDNEPDGPLAFTNKEVTPAENLTITDNNNQYNFVGNYVAIPEGNDVITENDYVAKAAAGQFLKAVGNGGTWLNSYRAYLKFVGTEAGSIAFNIGGEIIDGIEAVELMNKLSDGIYNLNGQKVSNAQKGIYIVNGKKVVLK